MNSKNTIGNREFAWVAWLRRKDGKRYPLGTLLLRSEPHQSEQQARDWAWAIDDSVLIRIEKKLFPKEMIVR
jgi:hypothetical protein